MDKEQDGTLNLQELYERILAIEDRNHKVSIDKAWETSLTRKLAILLLTYMVMVCVFTSMKNDTPLISAVVPTLGFLLSTLSLPVIKRVWVGRGRGL